MLSWDEFNQDEALGIKPEPKIEQKAEESQTDQQVPLQEHTGTKGNSSLNTEDHSNQIQRAITDLSLIHI